MHYLALSIGHTSGAVVTVLSVFTGGWRLRLGFMPACFLWHFEGTRWIYFWLAGKVGMSGTAALRLKFVFGLAMLFAPVVLMGGTLPVLTRLVTRTLLEIQERVSTLYFANSAGAVGGVILAEFGWILSGGWLMTVYGAAAMNLLADVLRRMPEAYPLYHWAQVAVCFLVMFALTVGLVMTLLLASRIATEEVSRTGRRVFGLGIAINAVIGVVILARELERRLLAWIGLPLLVLGIVSYVGWRFESTNQLGKGC